MRAYVDADVLIWHLRGLTDAVEFVDRLLRDDASELWTGIMQKIEVLFFMRPPEEEATRNLLSLFAASPIDEATMEFAGDLFRRWHPSNGLDESDALLAASAMLGRGTLYTLNVRHFPMPELNVVRPW